jgi:hypothetical protein
MANITTTEASAFIPEIWANTALDVLRENIVLARLARTDSDVGSFQRGDILNIPVPQTFSAVAKAADSAVTLQDSNDSTVTVTLNKHYETSFLVEDPVRAMSSQDNVMWYTKQAAQPLANQLETDLLALYSGFSATPIDGATGGALTAADLRAASQTLSDQMCPTQGRYIIINPKAHMALYADSELQNYFAYGQTAVAEGSVGHLYGFDVYESQQLPVSTTARGIAGTSDAVICAMRALPTDGNQFGARQASVTDPESGLAMRASITWNPDHLGLQVTLDVLYGVSELRDACGVEVTMTA